MNFVDYGTDIRILKSLPRNELEILEKAHPGTVPTRVMVPANDKHEEYMMTVYKKLPEAEKHDRRVQDVLDPDNNFLDKNTKQVHTLEKITERYNKLPKSEKNGLKEFIKDTYFVSNGMNCTTDVYRKSMGKYKYSRFKSVHKPIIERKLSEADTPPPGMKPICFMYGGGSASGKSTVIDTVVKPYIEQTGLKFANMDCDSLKEELPEHDMFKREDPNTVASRVHRESSDLCFECIDSLIKNKKCFTYDSVMGDFSRTKQLVDKLNAQGYDVYLVAVDIPVDKALERAGKRERKISEHIVRDAHTRFANTFPRAMKLNVTSFSLYDNSQPPGEPPTLIMDSDGIHHQEYYERFMNKCKEARNHGK